MINIFCTVSCCLGKPHLIRVGSPGPGTVGGGDGGLYLGPLPALHQVQLGALLQGVGGVGVDEAQAIAAGPLLRPALLAVPVLVTTEIKHKLYHLKYVEYYL